ncbi:ABC-2 type transport system ATP-binding protein [Pseudobutyrivibrio sp. YE44]|uniref:ABC transporter ATP-binding protein n=1 Tax=Pseudobutyrivibrio sp. YE44 TaxID=1520802 RepID=UPI00088A0B7B|nr:ABC transporter ATP-binding protein [Pseudobutyrivibrio sp. YE44]SDB24748.1 ABC-2 type transport system ATP-binding protein [Pseudobutyrivibrio sp. YE44]
MIEVKNLQKTYEVKRRKSFFNSYKEKVEAVKDISLRIEAGQIVGLLGINGAGKTTTIKMLTTLIEPTSGEYYFDGKDALKNPVEIKKQINMIAGGERMIYWRLTAYENLWYYGQLYGIENTELKQRIDRLLKLVGLEDKANLPVETFSKGMKQRLQIARGMINNPKYIFLDEPTIGLDAIVTQELHEEIRSLAKNQEKGILLTSHYLSEVEELCDYIYLVNNGQLVMEGTKRDLTDFVFTKKQYAFSVKGMNESICSSLRSQLMILDAGAQVQLEGKSAVITSKVELSSFLAEFAIREGLIIEELHKLEPSLEQAVIKLSKSIEKEAKGIA